MAVGRLPIFVWVHSYSPLAHIRLLEAGIFILTACGVRFLLLIPREPFTMKTEPNGGALWPRKWMHW